MDKDTEYKNLKNKIIIITGGSQGIGRSMVEEFVKQKSKVHFLDIDKEGAESLIKSLSSYNNPPTCASGQ